MQFELLGWSDDGVTLDLDHREFSYAGKFVMSDTGKAVIREDDEILAAASFSPDRTDADVVWIRYITVRLDRRGERIGSVLAATLRRRLRESGFDRVNIAVNNPFAFEACYRAGFAWNGASTGIAELVLTAPGERDTSSYRAGLTRYADQRTLSDEEKAFIADRHTESPPDPIEQPCAVDGERTGSAGLW